MQLPKIFVLENVDPITLEMLLVDVDTFYSQHFFYLTVHKYEEESRRSQKMALTNKLTRYYFDLDVFAKTADRYSDLSHARSNKNIRYFFTLFYG